MIYRLKHTKHNKNGHDSLELESIFGSCIPKDIKLIEEYILYRRADWSRDGLTAENTA